ncbi:rho GDP-dissociation inhibitor 1 [Iris pallida]|uniref:Rho GDP-dissociation inhibitor 1 n=1 Tax=Iris pallida TaxID=29817 RepID=A0AAX6G516_IRIPA|nr:rho GDP-dissociation inhibitor 1 [Iris pallida]
MFFPPLQNIVTVLIYSLQPQSSFLSSSSPLASRKLPPFLVFSSLAALVRAGPAMSLAVGAPSACAKDMGLEDSKEVLCDKNGVLVVEEEGEERSTIGRTMSEASLCAGDEEEEGKVIDLGPQVSLKDQLEKDKDDESLRRWKEQLLGSVDLNSVGENLEPEVKILSLSILSPGRPDMVLPLWCPTPRVFGLP